MKTEVRARLYSPGAGPAADWYHAEKEKSEGERLENEARRLQEELPLNAEQKAEVGDILLSARTVSRQMVTQAREQSDEILQTARDRAGQIVQEAEEKAAAILAEAEEKAAVLLEEAEESKNIVSAQMQDYVVQCVGDCFSRLRQQQLETVDFINEQWRGFLSGLALTDEVQGPPRPPKAVQAPTEEISRQDIEARVSEIAKELMEIIG
ncbi:MAG: hypothetical protein IJQ36_07255 [Oscillospiraceae bacterium]|nr:hypothetical protein [Oscillospiraceae bacterium]